MHVLFSAIDWVVIRNAERGWLLKAIGNRNHFSKMCPDVIFICTWKTTRLLFGHGFQGETSVNWPVRRMPRSRTIWPRAREMMMVCLLLQGNKGMCQACGRAQSGCTCFLHMCGSWCRGLLSRWWLKTLRNLSAAPTLQGCGDNAAKAEESQWEARY